MRSPPPHISAPSRRAAERVIDTANLPDWARPRYPEKLMELSSPRSNGLDSHPSPPLLPRSPGTQRRAWHRDRATSSDSRSVVRTSSLTGSAPNSRSRFQMLLQPTDRVAAADPLLDQRLKESLEIDKVFGLKGFLNIDIIAFLYLKCALRAISDNHIQGFGLSDSIALHPTDARAEHASCPRCSSLICHWT